MIQPRRLVLSVLLVLVALGGGALGAGAASSQPARRGIPRALRQTLTGCWALPDGEVHRFTPHGGSGLVHRWRSGTFSARDTAYYLPAADAVEVGCGARTQHGQHCEIVVEDGQVRFRRFAHRHGDAPPRFAGVEDARRCGDGDGPTQVEPAPR